MCFSALSASNLHKVVCIPKWFVKRCASKKSVFKLQYGNEIIYKKAFEIPWPITNLSLCLPCSPETDVQVTCLH